MRVISNLVNSFKSSLDLPARPSIKLAEYRKPWFNYWTAFGGKGWMIVGGPKRKAEIYLPYEFETRAIARAIAKYMARTARIRVAKPHSVK